MDPLTPPKNPNTAFQTATDPTLVAATYAPKPSTNIDVSQLGTAPTFTLPPAPATPNYAATLSAIPSISSIVAQEDTPTTADTTNSNLSSQLLDEYKTLAANGATIDKSTGKISSASAQAAAESAAGLPGFQAQLTEANNHIQSLQKEALVIPLQDQQDATGRGITAGGLAPIEAGKLRENTIQALQQSAIAQTMQGNITLAQSQADKAVAAQFAPVQAEIDYLQKAIDLNAPNMTKEDKERADLVQAQLTERQNQLDQQKTDKATIISWAAAAVKNNPGNQAVQLAANQALQTNDLQTALGLIGQYQTDPIAAQQAVANLAYTRSQANKNNADAAAEANPQNKPATQAQQTVAGYASRLTQANQIINDLSSSIASKNPIGYSLGGYLPSFLQGSDRQQYDQATRNFVNAVLRQESGAAISPAEFDSAEKQYFPQPGDSQQVIAQKSANRDLVIRNFVNASGNAYEAPPILPPTKPTL